MMSAKASSLNTGDPMSSVRQDLNEPNRRSSARLVPLVVLMALSGVLVPSAARSADSVVTGVLGSYTSGVWPFLIGMKKGFFAQHDIRPDVVFVPTAPGLVQQLAAGSLDIIAVNGLVEPLHAVEKGAPVAIMRIIGQTPNYVMIGRRGIADLKSLKGKKIAINDVIDEAVAWFYKPENRDEAIDILMQASKANREEIADSYDFLVGIDFFARTSGIRREPLNALMKEMVAIKDMASMIPIES